MSDELATPFTVQTPQLTLDEIAAVLWKHSEYAAYRSAMAYIKERDVMIERGLDKEKEHGS